MRNLNVLLQLFCGKLLTLALQITYGTHLIKILVKSFVLSRKAKQCVDTRCALTRRV